MVQYLENHPFTGQVLTVDDTPENRVVYAWYFNYNYHHYRFECKGVYGNKESYRLAHTYCIGLIEGKEGSNKIKNEMAKGERMNLPIQLMRFAFPENRMVKHVLTTFTLED